MVKNNKLIQKILYKLEKEDNNIKVYKTTKKEDFEITRQELTSFLYTTDKIINDYVEYKTYSKTASLIIKNKSALVDFLNTKLVLETKEIRKKKEYILDLEKIIKNKNTNYNLFSSEIRFPTKAINIMLYKDSKYIKEKQSRMYSIKSLQPFYMNGEEVLLKKELYPMLSHTFSSNDKIKITFNGTLVLIENQESFEFADKVFNDGNYLFLSYGGNASSREMDYLANNIYAERIIYFGDFDFVSLAEYNKLKEKINKLELYYGDSYIELEEKIKNYGNKDLYQNQEINYDKIFTFDNPSKIIWRILQKHKKCLEQEIFHMPKL